MHGTGDGPPQPIGRVGVEIGGTFTDLVWLDAEGRLQTGKTPSTPEEIHRAVLEVLRQAEVPLAAVGRVVHGSTVATNALLTRRGARTGLLTTAGFRDVLVIGRADRDHGIYDMRYRRPPPPIRRAMIREVPERMAADGRVLQPLDEDALRTAVAELLDLGVDAIALSFLHAYANPAHERRAAEIVREMAPGATVTASHAVSSEFREYERSVTTVANAFVGPVVERYLDRLGQGLAGGGYRGVMQIMQSNGGTMPAATAGRQAVRMLLSGPAAGVRAALWFAARNGIDDAITLDMGGTSTDVALAPRRVPGMVPELRIDGLPLRIPAIDMATIGAGGGSIAGIDPGGFLAVGPDSAGALPGPACYGRGGTRPTVTDAQVVAGLLRPERFFGGRMTLLPERATAALEALGLPGGAEAAADAVLRLVNSAMADAVRQVSTGRGIDPRGFTLVAYGGGGPLHGATVAELLGLRQVLVPWAPGLASAFGLLIAHTMLDETVSAPHRLEAGTLDAAQVAELRARAARMAAANGLDLDGCSLSLGLDMRYAGQAFELTLWTDLTPRPPADLAALFEEAHRRRYGHARPGLAVELVSYRLRLVRAVDDRLRTPPPAGTREAPAQGPVTLGGQRMTARFLSRDALAPGDSLDGPAVIEEATATTVVPPGWRASCGPDGDLMLRDLR